MVSIAIIKKKLIFIFLKVSRYTTVWQKSWFQKPLKLSVVPFLFLMSHKKTQGAGFPNEVLLKIYCSMEKGFVFFTQTFKVNKF